MQRAQLAILYGLDSLNTYNGHLRRERERGEQKWEARLLILYGLDNLNTYNATSPAGDIIWVRWPEHIHWPFEKREREESKSGKQGC